MCRAGVGIDGDEVEHDDVQRGEQRLDRVPVHGDLLQCGAVAHRRHEVSRPARDDLRGQVGKRVDAIEPDGGHDACG